MALQLSAELLSSRSRFLFVPKYGKLFKRHTLVDPWTGILFDQ